MQAGKNVVFCPDETKGQFHANRKGRNKNLSYDEVFVTSFAGEKEKIALHPFVAYN